MSDVQQKRPKYPQYRYTISQLLELSTTAWPPFDLSKFTYEAARAGVVPSLENCAMSSRKSSASSTRPTNADTTSHADLILFQGNRVQHPDRQPKLPPPVERQKDEGFVRFLKKHSSPTHSRVTAGGRIVPMEPKSPPVFTLPSIVTNRPQAFSGDWDLSKTEREGHPSFAQVVEERQQHNATFFDHSAGTINAPVAALHPMADFGDNSASVFFPQPSANGLAHVPINEDQASSPMLTPVRTYPFHQPMGGPVMPYTMYDQSAACNVYPSRPALSSAVPSPSGFYHIAAWPAYEQNNLLHDPMHQMTTTFQMLAAWEQHYVDLDLQLKNIDRHRAMHHLDPYLAKQRKVIVQQRSDAKDTVREYQMMLGIRRLTDSSQDSFATGFNVDAPAYIPSRGLDSAESMPRDHLDGPVPRMPIVDKAKGNAGRRAIPIVAPPRNDGTPMKSQQEVEAGFDTHETNDVDEWGVQKRPAPPDIQQEQSRLSDMLEAERQRMPGLQDDLPQYYDIKPSHQSQQSLPDSRTVDSTNAGTEKAPNPEIERTCQAIPRNSADEIQQVMDAIRKPKGTVTQVLLIDSRVIEVEGQSLDLSLDSQQQRQLQSDYRKWSEADANQLLPSTVQSTNSRHARKDRKDVKDVDRMTFTNSPTDKENLLVAPRSHQKAATDAFLAQYNAIESNTVSTAKPSTQSLRNISNGPVNERKCSENQPAVATNFPLNSSVMERESHRNLSSGQEMSTHAAKTPNSAFSKANSPASPEDLSNKSYSSVSVQNINAIGRLPQSLDGAAEAHFQLVAAEKAKSPRLLKRHGPNGGAWYGPYCREVFERARVQGNISRLSKKHTP